MITTGIGKVTTVAAAILMIGVGIFASTTFSVRDVEAQTANNNTSSSSQNQTNIMMRGPNITGSISIGPTIAKAIASQVHFSLENASMTAEKAVGANAHAVAVRIGVVHGFLVWMAFVLDSDDNFHSVIVDPGNGKVLSSATMMQSGMMGSGMMGSGMSGYSAGMMQHGMMQHGMMKGSGMMTGHP